MNFRKIHSLALLDVAPLSTSTKRQRVNPRMNPGKFTRWRFVLVLIEPNYNQKLKTQLDAIICV